MSPNTCMLLMIGEHEAELIELKSDVDKSTGTVGVLNTPVSVTGETSRWKIIMEWISKTNQLGLVGIYGTLHLITEYMLFLRAHGTFTKIEHILDHKINFDKFKVTEIIRSIFFDSNSS